MVTAYEHMYANKVMRGEGKFTQVHEMGYEVEAEYPWESGEVDMFGLLP